MTIGMIFTQTPDLIGLYGDHLTHTYQKKYCFDKNVGPDECDFTTYFNPYETDHPKLVKIENYFQLGQGPFYYILSRRCSNRIFHNPSAAPNDTGKVTLREYFFEHCSQFDQDASDLIFGK